MWPWIYRIIAALLAIMGAGILAAVGRGLHRISQHAGALVVEFGTLVAFLAGVAALILIVSAALIVTSPNGRLNPRG
jgi:hypothetical protein